MCPMAGCDIIPIEAGKACSGKCRSSACGVRVWVLAACEGMTALFEKGHDGHLRPLPLVGDAASAALDVLRQRLQEASQNGEFNQLVVVGGAGDIAWTQAALPETVSKKVVAEIRYPLIAGWFRSQPDSPVLTQAVEQVLQH